MPEFVYQMGDFDESCKERKRLAEIYGFDLLTMRDLWSYWKPALFEPVRQNYMRTASNKQ